MSGICRLQPVIIRLVFQNSFYISPITVLQLTAVNFLLVYLYFLFTYLVNDYGSIYLVFSAMYSPPYVCFILNLFIESLSRMRQKSKHKNLKSEIFDSEIILSSTCCHLRESILFYRSGPS